MEITLNKENFEDEVLKSDEKILVDFWAPWCGPCKMIGPVIEEIAKSGKIKVGKVNVDEEQELAIYYGITNIPTLIFFKNGNQLKEIVGFYSKSELLEIIDSL